MNAVGLCGRLPGFVVLSDHPTTPTAARRERYGELEAELTSMARTEADDEPITNTGPTGAPDTISNV